MAVVLETSTKAKSSAQTSQMDYLRSEPTQIKEFALNEALPQNNELATQLLEVALLLERQHANPFRIDAYRRAAVTLRKLSKEAADILKEEGLAGLIRLPTIGESIARAIRAMVSTGRLPLLERLKGESAPEKLLMTIPGIGKKTAELLHCELGIESLEQLELALSDQQLHDLAGIGKKRLEGIRDTLTARLGHNRSLISNIAFATPPISELLDVDAEYREKEQQGVLQHIAPKRFNPTGEAWLSVLHTQRGARHYTALYSNTARAHEVAKTRDWVVIYLELNGIEKLYTVITSQYGPLKGKRIVRGHEVESEQFYATIRKLL